MELKNYIERHLYSLEQRYGIKIMFWSLRSSINMGIYRKNSDLDIYFVFESNRYKLIHDLESHTFDFWGVNIESVKETIRINQMEFEKKGMDQYKPVYIDPAHKRAGCNYFYSLYFILGNDVLSDYGMIYDVLQREIDAFNKDIVISQFNRNLKNDILMILEKEIVSINEYLRIIWRCLFIEHLEKNGTPGDYQLNNLIDKYIQNELLSKEIKTKMNLYYNYAKEKNDLAEKNKVIEEYLVNYVRGNCL